MTSTVQMGDASMAVAPSVMARTTVATTVTRRQTAVSVNCNPPSAVNLADVN